MLRAAGLDQTLIDEWLIARPSVSAIEQQLQCMGVNADETDQYIQAYRKCRTSRRQTKGFICMSSGAILGFVSCVLTLINPVPDLYGIILYGLTSLAIVVIVVGLYLVFEQ